MALTYNELQAITQEVYLPRMTQLFADQNAFLKMAYAKSLKLRGGLKIRAVLAYQYNKGGPYGRGSTFDISGEQQITTAEWPWKYYYFPTTIEGIDLLENDSPEGVQDLLDRKMEIMALGASDRIATDFFTGTGTDSTLAIHSADLMCDDGSGTLTANSHGAAVLVYGGITVSTTVNTWWNGNTNDIGGTGIGPTYLHLQATWTKAHDGNRHPTIVVVRPETFDTFMRTQQPQQQYMSDKELMAGFRAVAFNGVPMVADRHVGYHATTFANNRIYMFDMNEIEFVVHPQRNFAVRKWMEPDDADSRTTQTLWAGGIVTRDRSRHSVGHNFDPADITDA
jgi:hypothetical protein